MHEYHEILGNIPSYLNEYLNVESLIRLKNVSYFCGMDYASKDVYDFKYDISRYDHSLSTALLTSRFTCDKRAAIAALFHDISTPVFSHVVDYMNEDYLNQESTEAKTEEIIFSDKNLLSLLKMDNINVYDIIDYKKYSLVDLDRPKLCADRIDGIILSSLSWVKNIDMNDVKEIIANLRLFMNEDNELEIGASYNTAKKLIDLENEINIYCHSDYDNYMMDLLSKLTKFLIEYDIIKYDDLYKMTEDEMFVLFHKISGIDIRFNNLYHIFRNVKKDSIKLNEFPEVKKRVIKPLVDNGTRIY